MGHLATMFSAPHPFPLAQSPLSAPARALHKNPVLHKTRTAAQKVWQAGQSEIGGLRSLGSGLTSFVKTTRYPNHKHGVPYNVPNGNVVMTRKFGSVFR
jgi:hypothetical protein